jgi:hypothetical protein
MISKLVYNEQPESAPLKTSKQLDERDRERREEKRRPDENISKQDFLGRMNVALIESIMCKTNRLWEKIEE